MFKSICLSDTGYNLTDRYYYEYKLIDSDLKPTTYKVLIKSKDIVNLSDNRISRLIALICAYQNLKFNNYKIAKSIALLYSSYTFSYHRLIRTFKGEIEYIHDCNVISYDPKLFKCALNQMEILKFCNRFRDELK